MDVLLWLVPPVVVTCAAMAWVSWLGREGRGEIDRDVAVRRLGRALEPGGRRGLVRRRTTPGYAVASRPVDRSTGVAVRRPRPVPSVAPSVSPSVSPPVSPSSERRAC